MRLALISLLTLTLAVGCGDGAGDNKSDDGPESSEEGWDDGEDGGAGGGAGSDGADDSGSDDGTDDDDDTREYEGDDPGECSDEADNDRNGLFDCEDPGCAGSPACTEDGVGADGGDGDDDDTGSIATGDEEDTASAVEETGDDDESDTAAEDHDESDTAAEDDDEIDDHDGTTGPECLITAPDHGEWFWNSDLIHFEAEVADETDPPEALDIRWNSDLDGILGTLSASASGVVTLDTILTAGYHLITLDVTDTDGNMTEETINLEIRDPMAHDGDLDGYSELAGDCDDADPYTSPGAEEICDAYDNDCDGEINEDFADEFEPSDSKEASYYMGTLGGDTGIMGIGAGADSSSLGMTLHSADDEDWVYFDADDDWFDSPNLRVEVGMFPAAGDYVVELYLDDTMEDIATGSGRLTVSFEGEGGFLGGLFSGSGDDDFWVRIYSDSWLASDCDHRYTVEVSAY
jgi:hypothetical protein